jgi:hypothetical protein
MMPAITMQFKFKAVSTQSGGKCSSPEGGITETTPVRGGKR